MNNNQDTSITFSNKVFEYALNMNNSTLLHLNDRSWLLDSGASCHIGSHKSMFKSLTHLIVKPIIYLLDGTSCSPKFTGSVYSSPHIILEHVYYIPEFKFNLISVSCLLNSSSLSLTVYVDKCIMQDLNSKVVGQAQQKAIYIMSPVL